MLLDRVEPGFRSIFANVRVYVGDMTLFQGFILFVGLARQCLEGRHAGSGEHGGKAGLELFPDPLTRDSDASQDPNDLEPGPGESDAVYNVGHTLRTVSTSSPLIQVVRAVSPEFLVSVLQCVMKRDR